MTMPHTPAADTTSGGPLAPVIAETRGSSEGTGVLAILNGLLPPGTRPEGFASELLTPDTAGKPEAERRARENLAQILGEPHVLVDVSYRDVSTGVDDAGFHIPSGCRLLIGVTFRPVPGQR